MAKRVSAFEARTKFGAIIDAVRYQKESYVVERNGRPVVAILDFDLYESLASRQSEDEFVEEYTDERIKEFLEADKVDSALARSVRRSLKARK